MRGMAWAAALVALIAWSTAAGAQDMPAPELIHGRALAVSDLPNGTVTVRVAREGIGNWLGGQTVTVVVEGAPVTARTDDLGRAEFPGLPRDTELRAEATVDGETLVSEPFRVPSNGGLRIILIAGIAEATARRQAEAAAEAAAPAIPGVVTLGGETRMIAEFQNDSLFVFYQLDIVNSARAPVDIGGPFEFELPRRAAGASLMDGAPKTATINGRHVVVQGPFPPGTTTVNVQFQLRYSGPAMTIEQHFPVAVQALPFFIERVGNVTVTSPQMQPDGERTGANGTTFAAVKTPGSIPAGSEVTIELSGLPAQSRLAASITLGLSLAVIGLGIWLSLSIRRAGASRQSLIDRRESLLARVEELELKRRAGRVPDDKYLTRRQRLISELEDVYHEIDQLGGRPRGGDEGIAA